MTSLRPPDHRPYSVGFRSAEVLKVNIRFLLECRADHPNSHEVLEEDRLCDICTTEGNVKDIDPTDIGDGPAADAPETGRTYLWKFTTLKYNHRCSLCRLIWRTFQPYHEKLCVTKDPPDAVLGCNRGNMHGKPKWIELMPMVFKNTIDNRDNFKSGQVYIYEDERIPHFRITELVTTETTASGKTAENEWRQTIIQDNNDIAFDTIQNWMNICQTQHGSICESPESMGSPARRLIDVESKCIVDGATATRYLALSYAWGMAAQFNLTKDAVSNATTYGYFEKLGNKIPETIRDAMEVCRKIGIRYLWVDAVCIIQDNDEDKRLEISKMDEIYGQALAVLIVAAGDGADSGIPGMSGARRDLITCVELVNGKQLITSLASATLSAKRSIWNTRAWTYQEYMLGARLLVFSDTHVFFKCSATVFRDDDLSLAAPLGPFDEWMTNNVGAIASNHDVKNVWENGYGGLLSIYLRRIMTFDSDAILAFAGVLSVLSKSMGPFHFGIPQKFFGRSLLWDAPHRAIFARRVEFPSWSWAGWKWTFDFHDSERSAAGIYGYDMTHHIVPIFFFLFTSQTEMTRLFENTKKSTEDQATKENRIRVEEMISKMLYWNSQFTSGPHLSQEELDAKSLRMMTQMRIEHEEERKEWAREDKKDIVQRCKSHFEPPEQHLTTLATAQSDLSARTNRPDHLIAFYTSVASLMVSKSKQHIHKPSMTAEYSVKGKSGSHLFDCYVDPEWRKSQPEYLEFAVVALKQNYKDVLVMLIENVDGIYYRVNWHWKMSQYLSVFKWMDEGPVQKLVVMG